MKDNELSDVQWTLKQLKCSLDMELEKNNNEHVKYGLHIAIANVEHFMSIMV